MNPGIHESIDTESLDSWTHSLRLLTVAYVLILTPLNIADISYADSAYGATRG